MTVNKTSVSLKDVEKNIYTVHETKGNDAEVVNTLNTIQIRLHRLQNDLDILKKKGVM